MAVKSKKQKNSPNFLIVLLSVMLLIAVTLSIIDPSLTLFSIHANGDNDSGSIIETGKKGAPADELLPVDSQIAEAQSGASVSSADSDASDSEGIIVTQQKSPGDVGTQADISDCGSVGAGSHTLTADIGSGGTCITITADGATINGQGHTINGDVIATTSGNGYSLSVENAVITGMIDAHGADSTTANASNGGSVTLSNVIVTNLYTYGGSQTGEGSNSEYCYCGSGGSAGAVSLTNSKVLGELRVYGGTGRPGYTGDRLPEN